MNVGAAAAKWLIPARQSWDLWVPYDSNNAAQIDHSAFQTILDAYLVATPTDCINRFDYAAVSDADQHQLQQYLAMLGSTDPRLYSRAEQRAYWINLYNALTIGAVLKHYPVKSIRKIYGGLLATGPWKQPLIRVMGQPLSLNDTDFGATREERLAHLAQYAKPELTEQLTRYTDGIKYQYDWRLNQR